jgi:hypothetical protein
VACEGASSGTMTTATLGPAAAVVTTPGKRSGRARTGAAHRPATSTATAVFVHAPGRRMRARMVLHDGAARHSEPQRCQSSVSGSTKSQRMSSTRS